MSKSESSSPLLEVSLSEFSSDCLPSASLGTAGEDERTSGGNDSGTCALLDVALLRAKSLSVKTSGLNGYIPVFLNADWINCRLMHRDLAFRYSGMTVYRFIG